MTEQTGDEQPGRRPGVRQLYPIFRRTQTGERVKIVKRWLNPLDPTFSSFYSVDAEGRFWEETQSDLTPAVPPAELLEQHKQWKATKAVPD